MTLRIIQANPKHGKCIERCPVKSFEDAIRKTKKLREKFPEPHIRGKTTYGYKIYLYVNSLVNSFNSE